MKKKIFLITLASVIVVSVHLAEAQQPKKVPRLGYFASTDPAGESARSEGIRLALRERGYIEAQNVPVR